MVRLSGVIALAALCVCLVAQAEEENPYKKAKVGDWVSYTMNHNMGGMSIDTEMKQTVVNKTDAAVTIEVATKVGGQDMKQTITIDLTKKYDIKTAGMPEGVEAEVKELDKGTENVTVAGKTFKTNWVTCEVVMKKPMPMTVKSKAWVSTDVPLGGMVKTEQDLGQMGKQVMEMKDCGFGK
jgi:hypothetical protein